MFMLSPNLLRGLCTPGSIDKNDLIIAGWLKYLLAVSASSVGGEILQPLSAQLGH